MGTFTRFLRILLRENKQKQPTKDKNNDQNRTSGAGKKNLI
jgi:hypothetical protein